jgi:hypothetical protein
MELYRITEEPMLIVIISVEFVAFRLSAVSKVGARFWWLQFKDNFYVETVVTLLLTTQDTD